MQLADRRVNPEVAVQSVVVHPPNFQYVRQVGSRITPEHPPIRAILVPDHGPERFTKSSGWVSRLISSYREGRPLRGIWRTAYLHSFRGCGKTSSRRGSSIETSRLSELCIPIYRHRSKRENEDSTITE